MIEVPSAVMMAESIAGAVDFFELGTNDLVQYTLAVDRGNDEVADWFRTLHPAVLQSIERSLAAARRAGIPAIVCGEMASTPAYAVLLIGLGATELSMTPSAIPRVRRVLSGVRTGMRATSLVTALAARLPTKWKISSANGSLPFGRICLFQPACPHRASNFLLNFFKKPPGF